MLPTLLLALLGLGAAFTAFSYDVGSFTGMGPGFFPLALGLILFLLGGVILWQDRQPPEAIAEQAHPFAWRPFAAVSAGILYYIQLDQLVDMVDHKTFGLVGETLTLQELVETWELVPEY